MESSPEQLCVYLMPKGIPRKSQAGRSKEEGGHNGDSRLLVLPSSTLLAEGTQKRAALDERSIKGDGPKPYTAW